MVKIDFVDIGDIEFNFGSFNVVLSTYEMLRERSFHNLLCKNHWHRIVLDECQELKCSTSLIATQCADLNASYRYYFMITTKEQIILQLFPQVDGIRYPINQ